MDICFLYFHMFVYFRQKKSASELFAPCRYILIKDLLRPSSLAPPWFFCLRFDMRMCAQSHSLRSVLKNENQARLLTHSNTFERKRTLGLQRRSACHLSQSFFLPATRVPRTVEHDSFWRTLEARCNSIVWNSYLLHTSSMKLTVAIYKLRGSTNWNIHHYVPTLHIALSFALTVDLTFPKFNKTTHQASGWGNGDVLFEPLLGSVTRLRVCVFFASTWIV